MRLTRYPKPPVQALRISGECAADIVTNALWDGVKATVIAAIVAKVSAGSGAVLAPAIMLAGTLHGAVEGYGDSEACTQVVQDTGRTFADMYNTLVNDDEYMQAVETAMATH